MYMHSVCHNIEVGLQQPMYQNMEYRPTNNQNMDVSITNSQNVKIYILQTVSVSKYGDMPTNSQSVKIYILQGWCQKYPRASQYVIPVLNEVLAVIY